MVGDPRTQVRIPKRRKVGIMERLAKEHFIKTAERAISPRAASPFAINAYNRAHKTVVMPKTHRELSLEQSLSEIGQAITMVRQGTLSLEKAAEIIRKEAEEM